MIKKILIVLGVLVGLLVLLTAISAWTSRDIDPAKLEAKYAQPPSQFIDVDGVRIHYRDEGEGLVVVLLHAHYASLLMWDPWVEALKANHRVIRLDMTSHGLTGPDASGVYTLDRTVQLFSDFIDRLGVDQFALAGTSMGGTVAMHYAARNPGRVDRLLLLSPGALNKRVRGRTTPPNVPKVFDLFTYVTPRWMVKGMLKFGFADDAKVTDALVDEWWDMWRREGNRKADFARTRQYVSGDIDSVIRQIRAPVLVMWGDQNPQVTPDQAEELKRLLVNSPSVEVRMLPGLGHMAVQEDPLGTAQIAKAFFDAPLPPPTGSAAGASAGTPPPLP